MNHIVIYTTPAGVISLSEGKIPSSWSYTRSSINSVELHVDEKTFKFLSNSTEAANNKQLLHD